MSATGGVEDEYVFRLRLIISHYLAYFVERMRIYHSRDIDFDNLLQAVALWRILPDQFDSVSVFLFSSISG